MLPSMTATHPAKLDRILLALKTQCRALIDFALDDLSNERCGASGAKVVGHFVELRVQSVDFLGQLIFG